MRLVAACQQFLSQPGDWLAPVRLELFGHLSVHTGTAAIEDDLQGGRMQIVLGADFIPEAEPDGLLLALFEAVQHALGPHAPFHPRPARARGVSGLFRKGHEAFASRPTHCRRLVFRTGVPHASTFLRPLAPRSLPASWLLRTL